MFAYHYFSFFQVVTDVLDTAVKHGCVRALGQLMKSRPGVFRGDHASIMSRTVWCVDYLSGCAVVERVYTDVY